MINLTNVALRRSPHERFEGPFIGPDIEGDYGAIVDMVVHWWSSDGRCCTDHHIDLIPYTPAPVSQKWVTCYHSGLAHTATPMIERAAAEALVDALENARDGLDSEGFTVDAAAASAALAAWEAGL